MVCHSSLLQLVWDGSGNDVWICMDCSKAAHEMTTRRTGACIWLVFSWLDESTDWIQILKTPCREHKIRRCLELFVQVSSPTESCWGLQEPYFAQWDFISNHLEPIYWLNKIQTYGYIHNTYILCCLWIPSCSHIPCLSQALGVRHGSSWTLSSQNGETKRKEAFEGINVGAASRVSARVRKKPCLGEPSEQDMQTVVSETPMISLNTHIVQI